MHDSICRQLALVSLASLFATVAAESRAAGVLVAEMAIEEVVVTATRREAVTSELSAAVSVVTVETIEDQKLVTDALRDATGVFVQQTTPGQGAAIVRGLRGSSILHLVDGMRLNNAIFRSAPTQYFALVPITAVDHIEVLRGTPTSLYGSDAVGGAVQVVTRMPRFESDMTRYGGQVYAGWDSAELGQRIGATLDAGNQDFAATASLEYLESGNRRIGGGERIAPSGYESTAARLAFAYTPDDQRRWYLDLHFLEQPSTPRVDELVPGFGQTEPSSSEFFFEPNSRSFAHLRYDHADGAFDLDWRFDLAWQRIDDDRRTRDYESGERRLENNRSDLAGAMLTVSRERERLFWLLGAEIYSDKVSSQRSAVDIDTGASGAVLPRFPDGSTLDQAALFVNAEFRVSDRQALSGGIRFNAVSVDLPQTSVSAAANVDVQDLSGDLGWRFDLDAHWQLVANVGFGFRAPNVFDLGTLGNRPGNRFNIPNTSLESENIFQADAGLRGVGDGWRLEAVMFALDYGDRITSVSTGLTTPSGRDIVQSVNAADSRIHGAEFGLVWQLAEQWELDANLRYTFGEQSFGGPDEPADRIPPLGGRLALNYAGDGALGASAWFAFADRQDRLSERDIRDPRIDPNGTPGWGVIGASGIWRAANGWSLSLQLDNLLDKRYRNHGSGIDAPGRNASITLRRRW